MKGIFDRNFKFRYSTIVIVVLFVAIIICSIFYFFQSDSSSGAILGSLVAGLIVALIQLIISWRDFEMTKKVEDLRLIQILYNRDDRLYYQKLISESRREIRVMGVTAKRFFEHFADMTVGARPDAQVLISAMNRGVKVKILLPSKEYITNNKKASYEQVEETLKSINNKYPEAEIEIRYFDHIPAHSIFMVDSECIVGPVFENVESKNTPALHLKNESPFAEKYIAYFEQEWKKLDA